MTTPPIDMTAPAVPTMVSATVVETIDAQRVTVQVEWEDNETREDEFCTNFTFGPNANTATLYASDYGATSSGTKTGTVTAARDATTVTATCWRWAMTGAGSPVALGSAPSNAVPVEGMPTNSGKGQGGGGKGHGNNKS